MINFNFLQQNKFVTVYHISCSLSNAINSYSIVELAITVCFEDFHETVAPPSVNT